jgi:hypothetical protein
MRHWSSTALALAAFTAAGWAGLSGAALAQTAKAPAHEIPQSLVLEHQDTLERLAVLAKRPGPVGVEARKARALFKRHVEREEEYILPPLTLLPVLADGKVTPDMAWALAMTDRVKADREVIFEEHTKITEAANALTVAGEKAHDKEAVEFARAAAADSLNDLEIQEPAVELIGEFLHSKLPPAH